MYPLCCCQLVWCLSDHVAVILVLYISVNVAVILVLCVTEHFAVILEWCVSDHVAVSLVCCHCVSGLVRGKEMFDFFSFVDPIFYMFILRSRRLEYSKCITSVPHCCSYLIKHCRP